VNGTDTEASGHVVPPATQPELFAHIYGRDGERVSAEDEEEEERRKFDYRLIAVPVLLGLIVFLAYQQRRSARDFFVMVREMVADQIAQLWPSEHDHARPVRRPAEPAKTVSARKRAPVREVQRRPTEIARVSATSRTPLRVSVEGQPGPQLAPMLARLERQMPFQPAVAVGITGAAFSRPVPPSPMRVQIAPTESLSLLLKQVPPVYPLAARHARIQGSVVLKAVIYKDGNVGELSLVSGHPMLVQAAMDAVKQWVYRPYYRNGVPMDVETLVVVEFSLAAEPSAAGGGL
jgi:TonB family protein